MDASWRAGGKGYGDYKKKLLEAFHATFDEARASGRGAAEGPGEVERILQDGAERARAIAAPVIDRVRSAVGLER